MTMTAADRNGECIYMLGDITDVEGAKLRMEHCFVFLLSNRMFALLTR